MLTKTNLYQNLISSSIKQKPSPAFALYILSNKAHNQYAFYMDTNAALFGIYDISNPSVDIFETSILNKTVKQIASELEASSFPARIISLTEEEIFTSADYIRVGTSGGSGRNLSIHTDKTNDGGYLFRLNRHHIVYNFDSKLRMLPPYNVGSALPWYVRIQKGMVSIDKDNKNYIFSIPEYNTQAWSLHYGQPYMDIFGEEVQMLSETSFKLSRAPIHYSAGNIHLNVDGNIIHSDNILDVDKWNGIVYLKQRLPGSGKITVDYTYLEESYIYTDLNINATRQQNFLLLGSFVLWYLLPSSGTDLITRSSTIRYVVGSSLKDAAERIPHFNHPVLLLGGIYIDSNQRLEDVNIEDSRTRGGGLYENKIKQLKEEFAELNFLWDVGINDGIPYGGDAAVVFAVPDKYFQVFSRKDLENRATKFIPAGIVPIFDREEDNDPGPSDDTYVLNSVFNRNFSGNGYWTESYPYVPTNYTGMTDSDLFTFTSNNNSLVLSPGDSVSQRYLFGKPEYVIKYKERTSSDGTSYGPISEKRISKYNRTLSGYLFATDLIFSADAEYKKITDVEVKVAGHTNENFYKELDSIIYNSYLGMRSITDASGRALYNYTDFESLQRTAATTASVPLEGQIALLDLYSDSRYSGYLSNIGNEIVASLSSDISGNSMPRNYSFTSGSYYVQNTTRDWTKSVRYLSKLYEKTSNYTYYSGASLIISSVLSISDLRNSLNNVMDGDDIKYTVSPYYYSESGRWRLTSLTLTTGELDRSDTELYLKAAEAFVEYDQISDSAIDAVYSVKTLASFLEAYEE